MAKIKNIPAAAEDMYKQDIKKKYGDVLFGLDFIRDKEERIIPIGPALDWATGGIATGTWSVIAGPPKSGKTTTAMQIAANAQKYHGMHIFYLNVETRFKKQNLQGMDFNPDLFTLVTSSEDKILSAEDYMNITENILSSKKNSLIIIDSLSSLCSESELSNPVSGQTRLINPRILASFCRKCQSKIAVRDCAMLGINHIISNTSGMPGAKTTMVDSGIKVQYAADMILHVKYFKPWVVNDECVGLEVFWNVVNSGLTKPHTKVTSYIRFGQGIDKVMEIFQLGKEFAAIEQSGAWYIGTALIQSDHEEVKKYISDNNATSESEITSLFRFQGEAKFCEFLSQHPVFIDVIYKYIKEMSS
jgi:recombination protein RecA